MNHETIAAYIADGKAVLGIEFGSTRIKAVLIGDDHAPIASGDHTWENRLEDGIWTYHLDDVWAGVQDAFANLQKDVQANYGVTLTNLAAFGVSGMMHGFLAFDENGQHDEDNGIENMIIRGDNLEALKALLPRYEGRVKCIYIDIKTPRLIQFNCSSADFAA